MRSFRRTSGDSVWERHKGPKAHGTNTPETVRQVGASGLARKGRQRPSHRWPCVETGGFGGIWRISLDFRQIHLMGIWELDWSSENFSPQEKRNESGNEEEKSLGALKEVESAEIQRIQFSAFSCSVIYAYLISPARL